MLKREFADPLLRGIKRSTIRLGIVVPKCDEVIVHSGGRPVAKAKIVGITYKKVSELTDEDAKLDGFNSVEELIGALRKAYGNVSGDDVLTIMRLEVVQRFDELKAGDIYYGLSPSDVARLGLRYLGKELREEEAEILELLSLGRSIREVASILYGHPLKRTMVRRVLRKTLRELVRRGIIKPPFDGGRDRKNAVRHDEGR